MEYEEFKGKVLEGLKETCGGGAEARVTKILKNNGRHYDGIQIIMDGADRNPCPALPLQWFYGVYCDGDMSIAGCVRTIQEISRENRDMGGIEEMVQKIMDWGQVKGSIYPVLLPTEENRELLEKMVSTQALDLSVVYIYRGETGGRCAGIKVSYRMLEAYGVSAGELHRQAMGNLAGDGYQFRDLYSFVAGLGYDVPDSLGGAGQEEKAFVLTNRTGFYGAAGILDRERVREFAGGRDFYILPSSIHETIFVRAEGGGSMEDYNCMVKTVNETELDPEEKLSDHAYFYDAAADEIRMCA